MTELSESGRCGTFLQSVPCYVLPWPLPPWREINRFAAPVVLNRNGGNNAAEVAFTNHVKSEFLPGRHTSTPSWISGFQYTKKAVGIITNLERLVAASPIPAAGPHPTLTLSIPRVSTRLCSFRGLTILSFRVPGHVRPICRPIFPKLPPTQSTTTLELRR